MNFIKKNKKNLELFSSNKIIEYKKSLKDYNYDYYIINTEEDFLSIQFDENISKMKKFF